MVSERKSKAYDIEKIHDFIDSLTFPAEHQTPLYEEIHHKLRQKKLFDEPIPTDEEKPSLHDQPIKESENTVPQKKSVPVSPWEPPKDNLPAWETVTYDTIIKETTERDKNEEATLPEFEPVPEDQATSPQDDDWLSSYELLEIEITPDQGQAPLETNQGVSEPVSFKEKALSEPIPVPEVPLEAPAPEPRSLTRKEERQEQERLRKELKQKIKLERQTLKNQEKEDRRLKRLEKRQQQEQALLARKEKKG